MRLILAFVLIIAFHTALYGAQTTPEKSAPAQTAPPQAAPSSGLVVDATTTCAMWMAKRQSADSGLIVQWVLGFISGAELAMGYRFLTEDDANGALQAVDAYCGAHPEGNLILGSIADFIQRRHGKPN